MTNRHCFLTAIVVSAVTGVCLAAACFFVTAKIRCEREQDRQVSSLVESIRNPPHRPLSDRSNWAPSRFFDDPKVIELCYAMERSDRAAVEKLLDEGVDINTKGRMTGRP